MLIRTAIVGCFKGKMSHPFSDQQRLSFRMHRDASIWRICMHERVQLCNNHKQICDLWKKSDASSLAEHESVHGKRRGCFLLDGNDSSCPFVFK